MSMLLTHYLKSESCFMQHDGFMLAYIFAMYYVIFFYHHHIILVNLNDNNYTENDGTCVLLRMPGLVKSYSLCVLLLPRYKNIDLWDFLSALKDHAMPLPGWPIFWIYATLPNNEESFAYCVVRQVLTSEQYYNHCNLSLTIITTIDKSFTYIRIFFSFLLS